MDGSLHRLLEESVDIAWVFLDRSGELGNGDTVGILADTIERMIRHGHRNRMFLANKAIAKFLEAKNNVVAIRKHA